MSPLVDCPDPDCRAPAEVVDEYDCDSTDGPIHQRILRCFFGHRLYELPRPVPLSHDPKCGQCGHAFHLMLCDDHDCRCDRPPVPGIYNEETTS